MSWIAEVGELIARVLNVFLNAPQKARKKRVKPLPTSDDDPIVPRD